MTDAELAELAGRAGFQIYDNDLGCIDTATESLARLAYERGRADATEDAARFLWMQDNPMKAQAFFWNYKSRKQRVRAIDAAMKEQGCSTPKP